MREIKFRAWRKNNRKMHKAATMNELFSNYGQMNPNGLEWMQYTGLKDRNGAEIYEGDLLCVNGNTNGYLIVEFKNCYNGGWVLTHESSDRHLSLGARKKRDIEVIGNIHENPELLEGDL